MSPYFENKTTFGVYIFSKTSIFSFFSKYQRPRCFKLLGDLASVPCSAIRLYALELVEFFRKTGSQLPCDVQQSKWNQWILRWRFHHPPLHIIKKRWEVKNFGVQYLLDICQNWNRFSNWIFFSSITEMFLTIKITLLLTLNNTAKTREERA